MPKKEIHTVKIFCDRCGKLIYREEGQLPGDSLNQYFMYQRLREAPYATVSVLRREKQDRKDQCTEYYCCDDCDEAFEKMLREQFKEVQG